MKKIISILLSIVFVLSMTASAFASEEISESNIVIIDTKATRTPRFSIEDVQKSTISLSMTRRTTA